MFVLGVIACTMGVLEQHQIDRIEQEMDTIDPSIPMVGEVTVVRGNGHGCGDRAGSCDNLGIVTIEIMANDDRTTLENMGYRLELVGGAPDVTLPDYDVRADDGFLTLSWVDGATDEQEVVDFTIRVSSVDLGGNRSTGAINVPVHDAGQTACECRPGARRLSVSPFALVLFAALALTARRLRRR